MTMRKTFTVFALLSAWAAAAPAAPADSSVPPEVLQAARLGLPAFLAALPPGSEPDYGFADSAETAQARLAAPYRLATLPPDALLSASTAPSVEALLTDTSLWYFPVLVNDSVRAVLVVDQTPAGWEAVSLGYAPLAAALDRLRRDWPESDGFHPRLVAVFQAREYLFSIPEHPAPNLTLLQSADTAARRAAPGPLQDLNSTLARLQPIVQRNLAEFSPPPGGAP